MAATRDDELKTAAAQISQAKANLEKVESQPLSEEIEMARAQVKQAQLSLDAAQRRLGQARLEAATGGTVVEVRANAGQMVAAGAPIVLVSDLAAPQVEAQVHESEIAPVRAGSAARVRLHAYPERWLDAEVSELAPLPSGSGALVSYKVRIAFEPGDVTVRPGMTADVEIVVAHHEAAVLVPRGALRREGGQWVVEVRRDGRWEQAVVTLGARAGRDVEVVDGLAEGAEVLIHTIPVALMQPELGAATSQRAGGR
jgi:RND family efflux transporter MFP subunit